MSTKSTASKSSLPPSSPPGAPHTKKPVPTPSPFSLDEPYTVSQMESMRVERKHWQWQREMLVEKMRGLSDLQKMGIEYRVRVDDYDGTLDFAIDCANGYVVLHIPRERSFVNHHKFSHSKRQMLERLIEQLTNQLAVEALEGR